MKLVFSKEEILDIVLQHVLHEFPQAKVNTVDFERYIDEVTVSYVAPVQDLLIVSKNV
jgi:hypothetical protein